MTRQMADDEVLRRYDSLINGCSDRYCPECRRLREIRNYVAALQAERDTLRAKTAVTLGVGSGGGSLFVHGDYDSIKAAQDFIFRAERAESTLEALRGQVAGLAELIARVIDAEFGFGEWPTEEELRAELLAINVGRHGEALRGEGQ